ncbi:MAG: IPT/TIG domain-containing protein [Anaerolineae bacterium]|nr:IPT/TIG domain-containing protein [Anaerolineae bacterium]
MRRKLFGLLVVVVMGLGLVGGGAAGGAVLAQSGPVEGEGKAPAARNPSPLGLQNGAKVAYVLEFSGSSYVSIPHSAELNPTGAFTLEAWVKRDNDSRCETVVGKGFASAYWLGLCNATIRFYSAGLGSNEDGNTAVPAGVWTHIAVVYKGSGREYYINGVLDYAGGPEVAPTTNTLPLYIGGDPGGTLYGFDGRIAMVRLWDGARTQDEIRSTMYTTIDAPLPDLVANWQFDQALDDNIGGHDGTANGTTFAFDYPPTQPAFTEMIDTTFNSLPQGRFGAGAAYVPDLDRVVLVGGRRGSSVIYGDILAVDSATGAPSYLGSLPANRAGAGVAYVASNDTVYAFGGHSTSNIPTSVTDTILAIDPETGATRTVTGTLPAPVAYAAVAYHATLDKVFILGGIGEGGDLATISIFDPGTESVTTPAGFVLPAPTQYAAAAYARVTGEILLFGGRRGGVMSDSVVTVIPNADGTGGTVTDEPGTLPVVAERIQATVDPTTHLIYVIGEFEQYWLWAYDPVSDEIWHTRVPIPSAASLASAAYAPRHRHLLLTGLGSSRDEVWRIPIGDGPLVPLNHWDFPGAAAAAVTAIDGLVTTGNPDDPSRVIIATDGAGATLYRSDGVPVTYAPGTLGSASGTVNDAVLYTDRVYLATADAGAKVDDGDGVGITTYNSAVLGTNDVRSVGGGIFYGTTAQGLRWQSFQFTPPGYAWRESFAGETIQALALKRAGELYALSTDNLKRLAYDYGLGTGTGTNFGAACTLLSPTDIAIGDNGDWWIVSPGTFEFGGAGVCRIPHAISPGTGSTLAIDPALGDAGTQLAVDAEGRVWIGVVDDEGGGSGGLAVFGSSDGVTFRTSAYNWLNAPLGSRTAWLSSTPRYWDSSVSGVGAAGERIWAGAPDGRLMTLAQRWGRVDGTPGVAADVVQDLWTARGRLFLATSNSLHVLMPDGVTWETLGTPRVWDVLGDSAGRTWVATNTGIRLYTPAGWGYLTDREGTCPATAVYALAEDQGGRVWIGGLHGLTLFDRDRFVATFNAGNSSLPATKITALHVDSENRLWAGTDAGLAMLDGATWTGFTTADGLPDNRIRDLDELGTGEVAISTVGGVSLYDGAAFTTQALPIPDNGPALSVDQDGRLWADNAVRFGAGGSVDWRVYNEINAGLASAQIGGNATDKADRVWFSHAPDPGVSVRGTYLPPLDTVVPIITGVSPDTAGVGDEVTITGSGFGTSAYTIDVAIGQADADVVSVSETEIRVVLTALNTSGNVTVRRGERNTTWTGFCAVPTLTSFSPTGGNDGARVDIYGANFDYNAKVFLGNTTERAPYVVDGSHLYVDIRDTSGTGPIRVVNTCDNSVQSAEEFRRIGVTLEHIVLNQGVQAYGLVADRPTHVQAYLSHSVAPRPSDRLEVDGLELTFRESGQPDDVHWTRWISPTQPVVTFDGQPSATDLADVANSLNAVVTPNVEGGLLGFESEVDVTARIVRAGRTVAQRTVTAEFRTDMPLRVLLVPITQNGQVTSTAAIRTIWETTNGGLENMRRRMFPTGRVEFYWSPIVYSINDLMITDESVVDLGDTLTLYDASHELDYARRMWNETRDPDVMIVYGVMDPTVNNGSAGGKAFWPNLAQMINAAGLTVLDGLCDVGAAVVYIFSLGTAGEGSCDLEVPLYVGWGVNTGDSSHLIGHEVGHTLGLVQPFAPNHDLTDNITHSVNDEIEGGERGTLTTPGNSAFYLVDKTFYRQPGVREPMVNPLGTGAAFPDAQLRANLGVTTTWVFSPTFSVTSEALTWRAKATMSYAANMGNGNSFFEPADMVGIFYEYAVSPARIYEPDLLPGAPGSEVRRAATAVPQAPVPIPVAGDRLYVSGEANPDVGTGVIRRVAILGENGPVDISYETGFDLVQRDGSGAELGRTGVFPVFSSADDADNAVGFFAATLILEPGVATLQLAQDGTVLDTYAAGSAAPTVTLSSPIGGTYDGVPVPVSWSADDADGDDLQITVLYSPDGGTSWVPVGISEASTGALAVPFEVLAGSTDARIKVLVSDGFHTGEAVSAAFTVTDKPPAPYIGAPEDGAVLLEGQPVTLRGGASDPADGEVAPGGLAWSSDRDGALGTGDAVQVTLSVGTHTLTLAATNDAGLSAATSITIQVLGDYDFDGIPDTEELDAGRNLLAYHDAAADGDGDGLSYRVEVLRGLNPEMPDTDGDGRDDGDEVGEGTDPGTADAPLSANSLSAYPASLAFGEIGDPRDLSLDTPMPQAAVQLLSRDPVAWTLTADVDWLAATRRTGTTPDSVTIIVNTERLPGDGSYNGTLTFSSNVGAVVVPVTATVINVPATAEVYLPVVVR